ncbi:MAG: dihydrolipoamide acetyltransferase family protein [Bacteroidota bacterium]
MAVEIKLPKLGETMEEGVITQWLVREGDRVERGQAIFAVQTDKVNLEYESPAAGHLLRILVPAGETVPVLTVVGYLGEPGEAVPEPAEPTPSAAAPPQVPSGGPPAGGAASRARTFASPRARRLAREAGIDPAGLAGSGPSGRVVAADVAGAAGGAPADPEPAQRLPLTPMRRVIARRLTESAGTIPHFSLKMAADVSDLSDLRDRFKEDQVLREIPLTAFLARAAALALREVPELNASFDGEEIIRHGRVNLGIAVALEDGLMVPVVRDADRLRLAELARTIADLARRAREGRLQPDECSGGTFTLSNLGMYGVDEFTAIINPPEAGILAVGRAVPTVVPRGDSFAVRRMLALTLSCDHRVVDGALGARFLGRVKAYLEAPYRLMV